MDINLRRVAILLVLVCLVALSGCSSGDSKIEAGDNMELEDNITPPDPPQEIDEEYEFSLHPVSDHPEYTSPDEDVIGWENGYWYDEPIDVTQSDGLNDSELQAYVSRATARVEVLRGEEFERNVDVTVVQRDDFQSDNPLVIQDETYIDWNNQVWEALFIVGEGQDISKEFEQMTNSTVLGYYKPSEDELIIVSDTDVGPAIHYSTLSHELVHALQDQRYNLSKSKYTPRVQDAQLASDGVIEGEARYIENKYEEYCNSEWRCVSDPPLSSSTSGQQVNYGIQLLTYQPYSDGGKYIQHLLNTGGWDAVDAKFENHPTSTTEILYPTQQIDTTEQSFQDFPDQQNGWVRFNTVGKNGTDSVGEVSMFMMLWYQTYMYNSDTIMQSEISSDDQTEYSYTSEVTRNYVDDELTPLKKNDKRGYIWRTRWTNNKSATEFKNIYENILSTHDSEHVRQSTWVIKDGDFKDAFYIEQDGNTVIIANAPDTGSLDEMYPDARDDPPVYSLLPDGDVLLKGGVLISIILGLFILTKL